MLITRGTIGVPRKATTSDQQDTETNAVRSKVYPYITDAIPGHGDKKKSQKALYLTMPDEDLLAAIDAMKFDKGETDIRVKK